MINALSQLVNYWLLGLVFVDMKQAQVHPIIVFIFWSLGLPFFVGAQNNPDPSPVGLFDGSDFDHWDMAEDGGWKIEADGSMTCLMKQVERKGKKKTVGMGFIWSKLEYSDFELTLKYKLSEGANSGVFYRTDRKNPVQGGFELQLMDNVSFQKTTGKIDPRKQNASFYDCRAPSRDAQNPIGEWNQLTLRCKGPMIQFTLNELQVIDVNIDDWAEAGKNPDGTTNKFKTALKDLPRSGSIGFQNHGQQVWFRDITIKEL